MITEGTSPYLLKMYWFGNLAILISQSKLYTAIIEASKYIPPYL